MAINVLMPNLGFDTQTGRLLEWLKEPGSPVQKGEAIAIIESDKANVELEALSSGILLEHSVGADAEVAIGAVIARIGSNEEYRDIAVPLPSVGQPAITIESRSSGAARVSPIAQRVADDLQVDLNQISGSGLHGKITRSDVEQAFRQRMQTTQPSTVTDNPKDDLHGVRALPIVRRTARQRGIDLVAVRAAGYQNPLTLAALEDYAAPIQPPMSAAPPTNLSPLPPSTTDTAEAEGVRVVPLSRTRQTIGKRLSESMQQAPHFYVTGEFVFDDAIARLKTLPGKVKINDLILYLTAQTLLRVPALNATFVEGVLRQFDGVNLALAVARDDGLITPVLSHAERYSLIGLAEASHALIGRARANRLGVDDFQAGTFTVSNMGMIQQIDHFTAVINPPQVGILAVGAVKPRPKVIGNGLFIRQTAHLTLSGDHRVVDGMDLARFMASFEEELNRFAQ